MTFSMYRMEHPFEMSYRNDWPISGTLFHSHAFYEIYYFQEGECTYLIGDKLMALRPGDLILMHGMTLHSPNPSPGRPYVRSIVHFDPGYVHRLLQPEPAGALLRPFEELRNHRISLGEAERELVENLLYSMNEDFKSQRRQASTAPAPVDRLDIRFLELLQLVSEWCSGPIDDRSPSSERERHVQEVVSYLEEHYREEVTLEAIAASLHLSKPYLANLFRKVTGTTIFKYLHNRRLNQAKILFRFDPNRSVSSVCREVGFVHPAHFSRLFKELEGVSPEVYRRRMRELSER
ncbi:hypothetical protein J19TS2_26490 [Cohnella xylanilytica]|uniref:helix-turn-helix transcriptional regulator n=1 Tax=Cohnella xylanilytica TaxID=557555 RepID=UPI001B246FE5|nr:AraC family transcriptional regulator [Cohnella xylanilytica]GIO13094.1 hypothetical protein J19TS2_26490 [Cohnella xylanilytica]